MLAEGVETLVMPRNGKTLYGLVPAKRGHREPEGTIQVIDPTEVRGVEERGDRGRSLRDAAATDAGLLYVSGGGGDWSEVSVVDTTKTDGIVTRYGGIWNRSRVRLAPGGERLFVSSQGVSPGILETLFIPARIEDKPTQYKAAVDANHPLGGDFVVSPDGKYLLCKNGTVLRVSAQRDEDLKPVTKLEPFLAALVDTDTASLLLLTAEGQLRHYSYTDFKLLAARIGWASSAIRRCWMARRGGCISPRRGADRRRLTERPRGKGFGDVFSYDVRAVLGKGK